MIILIFTMLSLLLGGLLLGLAIYPSVILLAPLAQHGPLGLSMALGLGYFISGAALLFWCALFHHLMLMHLKPGRHKLTSLQAFRWASASSLYMLVKFTVGDFFMVTPLGTLYLKVLGAKIGKNVMINSKYLHDHGLLEIGEGCLIGGDAVMSAHVAEGGDLLLSPIKLGKNVLISQKAVLMPGVEVGDNSIVAAGAIVLKDTKIPANEIWGGVPAKFLKARAPK
ncbi:MAG: acyltransferase [Vulcanimicrobiota bacterium]